MLADLYTHNHTSQHNRTSQSNYYSKVVITTGVTPHSICTLSLGANLYAVSNGCLSTQDSVTTHTDEKLFLIHIASRLSYFPYNVRISWAAFPHIAVCLSRDRAAVCNKEIYSFILLGRVIRPPKKVNKTSHFLNVCLDEKRIPQCQPAVMTK